ncbi:hypothetical protein D3C71_933280 [compost metagenome]
METHQAADIAGAEPRLVFKEEGMERKIVAGEDGGDIGVRHGQPPEMEAHRQWSGCSRLPSCRRRHS